MSTVDPSQCPLCQASNLCAVDANEPCWCVNSVIKPELLAQVPQALIDKSCICQQCINKFNSELIIDKTK